MSLVAAAPVSVPEIWEDEPGWRVEDEMGALATVESEM